MKILLVTLDSKYIHSNLAVRYLKKICNQDMSSIEIKEFTINQQIEYIVQKIWESHADVICFSCYIWNIEYIEEIAYILKTANSKTKILFGGPEVSFEMDLIMRKNTYLDYIIYGEGELTFKEFVEAISNQNTDLSEINGLVYRQGDSIIVNKHRELICNLDIVPYPYEDGEKFDDKIIYYESSRGCPFSCSFCMSSIDKRARNFSMDRVKIDLKKLLYTKARQIKFVDRTFNADYKRSIEIMKFIMCNNVNNMTIHFEITADIIKDEFLDFLDSVPVNMFQFEIGVQTLNSDTLREINRNMNIDRLCEVVRRIKNNNNIHMHLDLIAGLPYENYASFKNSFDGIHKLGAEKIQLGFLKVLKGTKMYNDSEIHGIQYRYKPPYEVIQTKYIGFEDLLKLKKIEEIVDKYYNEKYFETTLNYIINNMYIQSPFEFYEDFSLYWQKNDLYKMSHGRKELYAILFDYIKYKGQLTDEIVNSLTYDYVFNNRNEEIPNYLDKNKEESMRNIKRIVSNDEKFRNKLFKDVDKNDKIINCFRLVQIGENATAFIYDDKKNIFSRCNSYVINELIEEKINEKER